MSDSESMKEFETSLQRAAAKNPCLLIGGDLNLPGWNWINKTLHSGTQHAQQHYYFSDILDDHGLTQLVQEPTRNKNTLDLLITNYPSKILRIDVTPGISVLLQLFVMMFRILSCFHYQTFLGYSMSIYIRTHYPDSKPTSLCSFSLILRA
jgi:hypothetical protein